MVKTSDRLLVCKQSVFRDYLQNTNLKRKNAVLNSKKPFWSLR